MKITIKMMMEKIIKNKSLSLPFPSPLLYKVPLSPPPHGLSLEEGGEGRTFKSISFVINMLMVEIGRREGGSKLGHEGKDRKEISQFIG